MRRLQRVFVTCAGLALLWGRIAVAASEPGATAVEAANKAVASRVFEELFNQRRPEVAGEIYAPDFVNHGLHRDHSLAEDQAAARAELAAFPDLKMTIELIAADGDLVTVVWRFRGTHSGHGLGIPPTGTLVEMRGITVWRIKDGRLREEWTAFDQGAAYMQVLKHVWWRVLGVVLMLGFAIWLSTRAIRRARQRRALS